MYYARQGIVAWRARYDASVPPVASVAPGRHWVIQARRRSVVAWRRAETAVLGTSVAAVESSDTASITAKIWRTGQIASTDAPDTASIAVTNSRTAQIAGVESHDNAAVVAANWRTAQVNATETKDSAAISASAGTVLASVSAHESADTASVTGAVTTSARLLFVRETSDQCSILVGDSVGSSVLAVESADHCRIAANHRSRKGAAFRFGHTEVRPRVSGEARPTNKGR